MAGYPNGRWLEDDVIDLALNVAEGDLLDGAPFVPTIGLSDGVDANDVPFFLLDFPYVAMPHRGSDIT